MASKLRLPGIRRPTLPVPAVPPENTVRGTFRPAWRFAKGEPPLARVLDVLAAIRGRPDIWIAPTLRSRHRAAVHFEPVSHSGGICGPRDLVGVNRRVGGS